MKEQNKKYLNIKKIKKIKKQVKGITLIALVVTIIVLLILAGVALNLTIGQNGIFSRAQDAANTWRNAETNEQLAMNDLASWIDSVSDNNDDETEPTTTNIFAQLYKNTDESETLVFTNDDKYRESELTYERSYDITKEHYRIEYEDANNSYENSNLPKWIDLKQGNGNTSIKKVKIANEIKPNDTSCWFSFLLGLESIEGLQNLNTENTKKMNAMFYSCAMPSLDLNNLNTNNVEDMSLMFVACTNLKVLNIEKWNTENVINMSYLFAMCPRLEQLDLSEWITTNVRDFSGMFGWCQSLKTVNLDNWDISNAKSMIGMFSLSGIETLSVVGWDTRKVEDMSAMFREATKLKTIYVGPNWNTDNANTENMFEGCNPDIIVSQ